MAILSTRRFAITGYGVAFRCWRLAVPYITMSVHQQIWRNWKASMTLAVAILYPPKDLLGFEASFCILSLV